MNINLVITLSILSNTCLTDNFCLQTLNTNYLGIYGGCTHSLWTSNDALDDVNEDFMNIHAFQKLLIRIKTNIKLRSHNGCLSSNECSNSTKIDTMIWINCYLSTTQKHWSVIKAQLVLKTISNNYSLRIQPTFACSKVN